MCPDDKDIIDVRDRAYGIQRTAEFLFKGTRNALDLAVAQRAEEQARASQRMSVAAHRLNILAAIFFPIITLTAIFGVDIVTLGVLSGLDLEAAKSDSRTLVIFLTMIAIGFVFGAILASFVNRIPQWPAKSGRRS